ncbi:MAG: amidohydrolase family protein [Gemmatimonadetes bacterium]|nr:amidohydrolase family protein [Gemmatimonadota bacterium]
MKALLFSVLLALFGAVSGSAQQDAFMVLEGGTLIDGRGGAPIEDAVVVVRGDRIWAVGRRGQVPIPAGANVIRTAGRTILPGLIDMHLHSYPWKLPMYLAYGVTTVGDIHANTPWIIAQRALLRSGVMQGPRLFVSGARVIGGVGGAPERPLGDGYVTDVEEARQYVRYLAAIGVDMIKVDATITDEQLVAVIDEAKTFDLPVLGHLRDIDFAMTHGMKEMEHLAPFYRAQLVREGKPLPAAGSEEGAELALGVDTTRFTPLIQRMVEQEVIVDIALYGWIPREVWRAARPEIEALARDPGVVGFVPPGELTAWTRDPGEPRVGTEVVASFMRQYIEAGGKLLVSSDGTTNSPIVPGFAQHLIMQGMTVMGIPAMATIQGSTLWPAEALHIDDDYGSIEVGKVADFLIVEGNPLSDIRATRNVRMVIQGGKVMDTTFDPDWVNPVPRPTQFSPR